jgi:hypothetical protein
MVLVPVPDDNPLEKLEKDGIAVDDDNWTAQVSEDMDMIHSHNFSRPDYVCLQDRTAWINDHVISMFTNHMNHGMPPSDKTVCDKFLVDIVDFRHVKKRLIDFGEVVILDTADTWKIHEAYETGQYEGVLRVLSVKCSFTSVKRFLLSMNVVMKAEGMTIAQKFCRYGMTWKYRGDKSCTTYSI